MQSIFNIFNVLDYEFTPNILNCFGLLPSRKKKVDLQKMVLSKQNWIPSQDVDPTIYLGFPTPCPRKMKNGSPKMKNGSQMKYGSQNEKWILPNEKWIWVQVIKSFQNMVSLQKKTMVAINTEKVPLPLS